MSKMHSIEEFIEEMRKVVTECYRVLKPGKHCGILIGDTRRKKHHIPVAFRVLQALLGVGFILREDVIKRQWKTCPRGVGSESKNRAFDIVGFPTL